MKKTGLLLSILHRHILFSRSTSGKKTTHTLRAQTVGNKTQK